MFKAPGWIKWTPALADDGPARMPIKDQVDSQSILVALGGPGPPLRCPPSGPEGCGVSLLAQGSLSKREPCSDT